MENTIIENKNEFERILSIDPPFDKRHSDPKKNYGIHGINLRMVIRKNNNCTQFLAYLPVYLPHVSDELWNKKGKYNSFKGMGADVGYHAEKPQYEDQTAFDCNLLDGGKCYYDGSGLRAEEWYKIFLEKGIDEIWTLLEEEWNDRFENKN